MIGQSANDRHPNFRDKEGNLFLVRCFVCECGGDGGIENWAMAVATGTCAWCGWCDEEKITEKEVEKNG